MCLLDRERPGLRRVDALALADTETTFRLPAAATVAATGLAASSLTDSIASFFLDCRDS